MYMHKSKGCNENTIGCGLYGVNDDNRCNDSLQLLLSTISDYTHKTFLLKRYLVSEDNDSLRAVSNIMMTGHEEYIYT